jgi:hypothetical protein
MSRRSLGRLLEDLKFHPYKMQIAQELREIDKVNRYSGKDGPGTHVAPSAADVR